MSKLAYVRGQRVVLANYQPATITGVHPAHSPIILSGERAPYDHRTTYPTEMFSVTWQDTIDVVVTLTYDAIALTKNGNEPGVDRWHLDETTDMPVWAGMRTD